MVGFEERIENMRTNSADTSNGDFHRVWFVLFVKALDFEERSMIRGGARRRLPGSI